MKKNNKVWEKIKNFVSVPDEDYYDGGDNASYDDSRDRQPEPQTDYFYGSSYSAPTPDPSYSNASSASQDNDRRSKVVNIHATTQLQVVLVKPEKFEEAKSIADHLNSKRTVVLNLEACQKEVSRRLVDFLSGVAYANKGDFKQVANSTFLIAPYNVDVMGDVIWDELENSNFYL